MCNLGEGIYERAVAEEQRQAIETEKLLKELEAEKNKNNKRIQELIAAGVDPDRVNSIMGKLIQSL